MHASRLGLPAICLAVGSACASYSAQRGMQTPALPLEPGGPVEGGVSLGGFAVSDGRRRTDDEGRTRGGEGSWELSATGHVRVPLTWGTSLRTTLGTGSGASDFGVEVLHAFRPHAPHARWQGAFGYGISHRFQGATLVSGGTSSSGGAPWVIGMHGVQTSLRGAAALGPRVWWAAGGQFHLPLLLMSEEVAPALDGMLQRSGTVRASSAQAAFTGEIQLSTGPVLYVDVRDDARSAYFQLELGVGMQVYGEGGQGPEAGVSTAAIFQITGGVTQRPRFGRHAAPDPEDELEDDLRAPEDPLMQE